MPKKIITKNWTPWIVGWFTLFLFMVYMFLGPVQQTIFSSEINLKEQSAKVYVNSDNDKIVYSVIYGFFGSLSIIALIWGAVRVYEIKHK